MHARSKNISEMTIEEVNCQIVVGPFNKKRAVVGGVFGCFFFDFLSGLFFAVFFKLIVKLLLINYTRNLLTPS